MVLSTVQGTSVLHPHGSQVAADTQNAAAEATCGISVGLEMSWHKYTLEEPQQHWLWSPLRARQVTPSHPDLQHNNIPRFHLQSHNRENQGRSPQVNFNQGIY